MRIDYSIKQNSKHFLFLDVPFRQSAHHISIALSRNNYGLSAIEKIKHLALGILKFIPVIGHLVALCDTAFQRKSITLLKLTSTSPFERGKEHGQILKKRIQEVYDPILHMKRHNPISQTVITQFEKQIPDSLKDELKGLAQGSGYSYEDVLLIHTFLDAEPGQFGCTSMAVKQSAKKCERIAAANHLLADKNDKESYDRRKRILSCPISKNSKTRVLQSAGKNETIQSMVFDTTKGKVHLASSGTNAADEKLEKLGARELFGSHTFNHTDSDHKIKLFRNLDWPWYFLGQETLVLVRPQSKKSSTVSISWPGYIGTLSGMNNNGLALTENQCGSRRNETGIPNPLLFTHILDTCKNVPEAHEVISKGTHGSSMNLVIADKNSAKSYELKGCGVVSLAEEI